MITDALLLRNATMHLGGITLGPHNSNRFMINIYYTSPVDLRTILKDTDPIDCVYTFIILAEEVYHTVWLYRGSDGKFKPNGSCYKDEDGYRLHLYTEWHDDGTASYEHIYICNQMATLLKQIG